MVNSEGVLRMKKQRGIMFSIDAVFALYIALILTTAFAVVLQAQEQTTDDMLTLSRLARDYYNIKEETPGAPLPGDLLQGAACNSNKVAGSALVFVYNPATNQVETSSQVVCVSGV